MKTAGKKAWNQYSTAGIQWFVLFCSLICLLFTNQLQAQCVGPVISTFPYSEGFESAPAWTTGGTNNDWAWGSPTHATISSAGGGTKCWCVGGLTGSFYNYSELSWIQSPCFNFSTLNYPWISFKIFWEDEYKYDGLVLQSSTDGGVTWVNIGAFGDPVDCMNANWYNYGNITWLTSASPKHGWCGRIGPTVGSCQGTNGSGGWVTAKHCLNGLANKPNVMFRFLFGAGTTCNSYDGIAIDDVLIENTSPNVASFTYACAGPNTINFTNSSPGCPTGYTWNFGDPGSGALNTSSLTNPSHTYPAGSGTYTVTLTDNGPCNAPGTVSIPVQIGAVAVSSVNITCNGMNNGSATATVSGGTAPYTYSWTPGGQTAQTATGLAPGTYTVDITGGSICPISNTVTITQPAVLTTASGSSPATCGNSNGSANVTPAGGTAAYTYSWSPVAGNTSSLAGLAAGSYTCLVTDANGCTTSATIAVTSSSGLAVNNTMTNSTCMLANGSLTATPAGGASPYTYSWSPAGGTSQTASGLAPGLYTCVITDASGCTKTDTMTLANTGTKPVAVLTSSGSLNFCAGQNDTLHASGGGTYSWSTGATTPSIVVTTAGTYKVVVTNACGKDSTNAVVTINPLPVAAMTGNLSFCAGSSTTLTASGGTSYSWNNGSTSSSIVVNTGGTYAVVVKNACGSAKDSSIVTVDAVTAHFTPDSSSGYVPLPVIFTNNSSANAISWLWNFGDGSTATGSNPTHTFGAGGTYTVTLTVTDAQGCSSTYTEVIVVKELNSYLNVPNVFTPNGDGSNDVFLVKSSGISDFDMKIYDRWGVLITESVSALQGWDGRTKAGVLVSEGTYYFIINARGHDGKTFDKHGYLTLLK
ncbi:MAG: PKD domain-containing protein [Bacteroidia bacterium]